MKHAFTLLLLAGTGSASGQWLTDSLIAHFPMDGSPNDIVGGLAPIATIGNPDYCESRTGDFDSAACFGGADFWRYGDVLDMDTTLFSISFWCRIEGITSNTTAHDYPLSKGTTAFGAPTLAGYAFGFRDELPDTLSAAVLWGQGIQPVLVQDEPITYGSWNHFTMSRCPSDVVQMHVNGTLVVSDTLGLNASLSTNIYFSIGAGDRAPAESPNGFFQGAVDDIRVYKGRCLTQAEINVLADLTMGVHHPSEGTLGLLLSPNPATNSLRIMLPPRRDVSGPVQVYDATGRLVPVRADGLTLDDASVRSMQLNVAHLPQGAYFVVVPTENGLMHGRFVKE
ncbi:MAG: T9SS type A sorting domain-containing protein [Flavobacteriales bacterium]|nr:T9SS type A sorting domain-containing protein [Flavobacteriales bacterium]